MVFFMACSEKNSVSKKTRTLSCAGIFSAELYSLPVINRCGILAYSKVFENCLLESKFFLEELFFTNATKGLLIDSRSGEKS